MLDLQYPPYIWPTIMAAAACVFVMMMVWRRRPGPGVIPFAVLISAVIAWSVGNTLEMMVTDKALKLFFIRVDFLPITLIPAAWFAFVLEYTGRVQRITWRMVGLLAIQPILVQLMVWSNGSHQLFWRSHELIEYQSFWVMDSANGPAFWAHGAYSYALLLISTLLLLQAFFRSPELYRGQVSWLLAATLAPWFGNMMYLSGVNPLPYVDLTPLAFSFTAVAMGWSLYRYRLLDVVPIARNFVIESMSDAVIVLDVHSRVVDLNPAARSLLGLSTHHTAIGKPLADVVPQYGPIIAQYRANEEVQSEISATDGDGKRRHFELRLSPLRLQNQAGVTGSLIMLREITRHKQSEEQIRAQNEALVRANRDLGLAREQAEEANRLKSEFLATISHELRTPLNAVIGYTDLLLTGLAGELNAKQQDYIQRCLSNGERQLDLINELLDLSKIEAGRLQLVPLPFSIREVVEGLGERMQGLADRKNLVFNHSIDEHLPETLEGDAKRIEQVMVNLVGNAIKYTEKGRVDLRVERFGDTQWTIIVADTGIGIPPHALEFIFDKFRQVDGSTHRQYQGTGLGLTIVRELTYMMGGTVHIESELNQGSTFTVRLPLVQPDQVPILEQATDTA